jgi:hypothetical protein
MPFVWPGKLYQNSSELQPTSCASSGGLEDPGRVHGGRNDYCGLMCAFPFYELKNEIDDAMYFLASIDSL